MIPLLEVSYPIAARFRVVVRAKVAECRLVSLLRTELYIFARAAYQFPQYSKLCVLFWMTTTPSLRTEPFTSPFTSLAAVVVVVVVLGASSGFIIDFSHSSTSMRRGPTFSFETCGMFGFRQNWIRTTAIIASKSTLWALALCSDEALMLTVWLLFFTCPPFHQRLILSCVSLLKCR